MAIPRDETIMVKRPIKMEARCQPAMWLGRSSLDHKAHDSRTASQRGVADEVLRFAVGA